MPTFFVFVNNAIAYKCNLFLQAISKFPSFHPALAEKALLLASSNDWEQALDAAQRLLDLDADHLDALQVCSDHHVLRPYL